MAAPAYRPSRVVIVDADNPLVEIKGEFFWREDHEAIVEAERERAYRAGVFEGMKRARASVEESRVLVLRRRRTVLSRIRRLVLAFILLAMLIGVLAVVTGQLLAPR